MRGGDISLGFVSHEMGISVWGLYHMRWGYQFWGVDISLGFVSHKGWGYQFRVCITYGVGMYIRFGFV